MIIIVAVYEAAAEFFRQNADEINAELSSQHSYLSNAKFEVALTNKEPLLRKIQQPLR
ncbi:MAG: hypothetical protein VZT48_07990 [Bulleidia sp.]|nr:hypothetical protein [Bulleidia sp.]